MGKQIGVGLQLGAPTAVTAKFMLAPDQGLVAGIGAGYGFFFAPALSVHVDYLWHPSVLSAGDAFALSWFIGGGGWIGLWDRFGRPVVGYAYYFGYAPISLAVRVPIGLSLALRAIPLELYGEVVPALSVFPWLGFGMGLSIGARFYF